MAIYRHLRAYVVVTRTGIESSLSHFASCRNMPQMPVLRDLITIHFFQLNIKYHKLL